MLWIGLLSGTSADGIDAAVAEIDLPAEGPPRLVRQRAFETFAFADALRTRILSVSESQRPPLDELLALDALLGEAFAVAALEIARAGGADPEEIVAVGSHGQTVRHLPVRRGEHFFLAGSERSVELASTLQLGDPAIIAERTGWPTIARFRHRDLAAGGQGAPLVPIFHLHLLETQPGPAAIANVGGIANVTLPAAGGRPARAFDTGPGNMVIDALAHKLIAGGPAWDEGGAAAAGGTVHEGLLATLLADPYFALPPPKSTGRERFGQAFAHHLLARGGELGLGTADLLATATALTAASLAAALEKHGPAGGLGRLFVCGGGAHNQTLMAMLKDRLPDTEVGSTAALGYEPDAIEALAFAYLAACHQGRRAGNLPGATGARHPVVLGEFVPGRPR